MPLIKVSSFFIDIKYVWYSTTSVLSVEVKWLPSWIFLVKASQLSLPHFIGEHLMQQVGWSMLPEWPAQHICMSGVYSLIYSSSKWQWESFYFCVRPLSSQPISISEVPFLELQGVSNYLLLPLPPGTHWPD